MRFQCALLLSLAVLCLGKPAKQSANEASAETQNTTGGQASPSAPSETTGTSNNQAPSKCPIDHGCVSGSLCPMNRERTVDGNDLISLGDHNARKDLSDPKIRRKRYTKECGVRHESPQLLSRVSSGYLYERGFTSYGEFPWHVALLVRERVFRRPNVYNLRPREDVRYKCGGSLIDDKHIVTAAHCVFGERVNRLKVHLGEWNLQGTTGELFPAVEREIANVHIHSGFNPATYAHDIAVLKMSSPVDFTKTPHISPVCLPTKPFKDHKKCFIVGWGDDVYKPNFGSNILRSVSVLYTGDHDECRAKLFSSFKDGTLDPSFNLDEEHQKCIIGEYGKDACVGDGGGAVVCPLTNEDEPVPCDKYRCAEKHYFIAGILSYGSPNCGESSTTIITDILRNKNWINAITAQTY